MTSPGAAAAKSAGPELDLAFRLETGEGLPLPPELAPLQAAAGSLASPGGAEERWRELLEGWLAQLAPELPSDLRAGTYSLGLLLTDDASIAALNRQWRQRDEPTDVLSFAALESGPEDVPPLPLPPGLVEAVNLTEAAEDGWEEDRGEEDVLDSESPDGEPAMAWPPGDEPLELGDIVISLETAARQAAAAATELEAELLFLASHGLLHLLGWDHPDDQSLTAMLSRQEALIARA